MSLQQNINNSIFSLTHMKFMKNVSDTKDYRDMMDKLKQRQKAGQKIKASELSRAEKRFAKRLDSGEGLIDWDNTTDDAAALIQMRSGVDVNKIFNDYLANSSKDISVRSPSGKMDPMLAQRRAEKAIVDKQMEYEIAKGGAPQTGKMDPIMSREKSDTYTHKDNKFVKEE